jgi:hypothetical protein
LTPFSENGPPFLKKLDPPLFNQQSVISIFIFFILIIHHTAATPQSLNSSDLINQLIAVIAVLTGDICDNPLGISQTRDSKDVCNQKQKY